MASCRASISWLHRGTYSLWWIGKFFLMLLKVMEIERKKKEMRTEELEGESEITHHATVIYYRIPVCRVQGPNAMCIPGWRPQRALTGSPEPGS